MGTPTKTQVEAWTDEMAASVALAITGFRNAYLGKTVTSLADAIDGSGDFAVEAALLPSAVDFDEMSLPEYARDFLPYIAHRPEYKAFISSLNTLVKTEYDDFRAYLVGKSAKLHPLVGEVVRAALSNNAFGTPTTIAGVSNPFYGAADPTRIWVGADGSLASELTDATDVGTADVTLFGSDNHTLYIGCDRKFSAVVVALSTLANATITPTFQYWNGNAWTTLTVTDNSTGFTKNDIITFTPPSDWSRNYKDAGGTAFAVLERLYYIRIARTADTVDTPPVGTSINVIPTTITQTANGSTHASFDQPPLAICRITAANTLSVTLPASIDSTRFALPVGTENKLRLRALTPIAQNLTVTLAYVNGSAANASTAQSSWTAPAAQDVKVVALTSSDALISVRTASSVSTSATEGVFVVEALPIRTPAV